MAQASTVFNVNVVDIKPQPEGWVQSDSPLPGHVVVIGVGKTRRADLPVDLHQAAIIAGGCVKVIAE